MFQSLKDAFDFVFFRKAVPAIRLARVRPLEAADLPELPGTSDPSQVPLELLEVPVNSGLSLIFGMAKVLKKRIAVSLFLAWCYSLCILSGPLLVYALVDFVKEAALGKVELEKGVIAGFLLCLTGALTGLLQHHYFYNCLKICQSIGSALNLRVFRHGLVLTREARLRRQTGDIVNLLGTDSDILSFTQFEAIEFVIRVFMLFASSAMLVYLLGPAGLLGLLALIVIVPLARKVAKNYLRLDDEIMKHRDARVSLMSSLLSGIRIVKFFAWEKEMQKEVALIREQEIRTRRSLFNNTARSTFIYYGGSLLVGLVAFLVSIAWGNPLDTPTLFAALALFGLLESTIGVLSEMISILAAGKVSADRIASFLNEPSSPERPQSGETKAAGLKLEHASFQFEDAATPVLSDINLDIRPGESVAVIGSVGSGKTSLLLSLLNEVPLKDGHLRWSTEARPEIAFVPQEALVLNGTLRDNIELGLKHDEARLNEAIAASALKHDIAMISGGLSAEIGEHGINLSGGQKQRVNLARAARREASVYLLDDPISAVDVHTEDALMRDLIFGLWKDKTRVMVTHRLHHLSRFDRVVFLDSGKIVAQGTFAELDEHCAPFRIFRQRSESSHGETLQKSEETSNESAQAPKEIVRITDEEEREIGGVDLGVYKSYARAWLGPKRGWALALLAALTTAAIGIPVLQNTWLAYWSDHRNTMVLDLKSAIWIWGALGLLSLISAVGFQRMWLLKAQAAGRSMHDAALDALLRSPLNYFDRTPIGRILNRFSRDMDSLEREIASNLERTTGPLLHTVAAITLITVTVPLLLFMIGPALIAYYGLQKLYRAASRDAQRLTSISRSPRFAFFKESIQASAVIRAHGQVPVFVERYEDLLRAYQKNFHGAIMFNRWFSSRIPMLGATITFGLISTILWLSNTGSITAGAAGLSLVYALRLFDHLNNAIRSFTVVESNMIGVERLSGISRLSSEVEPFAGSALPENMEWPISGEIRFEKVSVRYAPHLPLVLKDCDFTIRAREKIGIIGRTGAGKSTLFQVLYRFVVPTSGRVLIDGMDTAQIPLSRLRRSLAIIPQDPILFQGTLRSNLDRFEAYQDDQIWTALRRAHLEEWVRSLEGGLNATIQEAGANFSQGQRQQLCLARALLLDTKIIVLDEATASVDVVTDARIQETLRDECRDKTVLIIAHRLETLTLCDRVIEMKDGVATFIR